MTDFGRIAREMREMRRIRAAYQVTERAVVAFAFVVLALLIGWPLLSLVA